VNTTPAHKRYYIKPLIAALYKYNQYSAQDIIILEIKKVNCD